MDGRLIRFFSIPGFSRCRRSAARLGACAAALLAVAAHAQIHLPAPAIASADASGNSVYALTFNGSGHINGTESLASGGAQKLTVLDALVWVPDHSTSRTALDLVAADATHGRILLYPSPHYGSSTAIFTYKNSGPAHPTGLAADAAGNIFITSLASKSGPTSLWVLPFDAATGQYDLAPVPIDQSFGGVKTVALAEVLVAGTAASTPAGSSAPAWNAGDILVLVGDTFNSWVPKSGGTAGENIAEYLQEESRDLVNARVMVYRKSLIYQSNGALATSNFPLNRSIPAAVTMSQFAKKAAIPFGMDIWPADATHGVSLLFTTFDGRVIRFDTSQNAFVADFADRRRESPSAEDHRQGIALQKIKVATTATASYAFVAEPVTPNGGKILQFGAPPASGPNNPIATLSQGVGNPVGLAASNSLVPVSSCEGQNCSFGPGLTLNITCPVGGCTFPAGATIQEELCVVQADPRVTVTPNGEGGYNWSCGSDSQGNTTLDVANFCPNYPSTVLPSTICGHSGPTGSGIVVQKGTAEIVDLYNYVNDTIFTWVADVTQYLPSPLYDLSCQPGPDGPLTAWAPRSDLYSIEGSIVEGGPESGGNYFFEDTGACDESKHLSKSASMGLFGIALNVPSVSLPAYENTKINNWRLTLSNAQSQVTNPSVVSALQSDISTVQSYFNSGNYNCALNELGAIDAYLQAHQTSFTGAPPPGNPNLYGELWQRTNNLYLSIIVNFTSLGPNTTMPPNNVPACNAVALNQPSGLAFYNGNLYVANYGSGQVLVYAPGQNGQMVLQPSMTLNGMINPVRLAVNPNGWLFVADTGGTLGNNTVSVFNSSGASLFQITGLTRPLGVAADANNYLYVAENYGGTAAVNDIRVYSITEGPLLLYTFTGDATGLAFNSVGALAYNGTDLLVGLPNEISYYLTSDLTTNNGNYCKVPPCPPPQDAKQAPITSNLDGVIGIAVDPTEYVYVTDYYGDPTFAQYAPVTGKQTSLNLSGGPALSNPQGIALDASGNIYVSNTANNAINVYHNGGVFWYTIQ